MRLGPAGNLLSVQLYLRYKAHVELEHVTRGGISGDSGPQTYLLQQHIQANCI